MNITLFDTKVIRLNLGLEENSDNEEDFNFSFTPAFDEASPKSFLIVFNVLLKLKDQFALYVEYAAQFSTDEDMDDAFKTSHFIKVNAPAIAYPFLRAYISNFTLNSGFSPVILPTINFTKF